MVVLVFARIKAGASADFEAAVAWAKQRSAGRESKFATTRTAWIAALQAGTAPAEVFDAATLEQLRGK